MQNLRRLAERVLRELHEPIERTAGIAQENEHFPWNTIHNALNTAKDDILAELLLSGERYRTLLFPTDTPLVFSTPATGNRIATLPGNVVRVTLVEALVGAEYVILGQWKPSEAYDRYPYPGIARQLSADSKYVIDGDGLFLDHASAGVVIDGIRVYAERDCPDLLVGTPAANTVAGNLVILAQDDDDTLGQMAAELDDNVYSGLYLQWIQGQGGLLNTRSRILSYAGATQTCTMDQAWSTLPLSTDTYAMMTPFPRAVDRLLAYYAAGLLMGESGEDPGVHMTTYERLLEKWMQIYDNRSSGQNRFRPYEDDPD